MKADIAIMWVDALESGEYEQGIGKLQPEPGKFCCLGVLTDLYVKEHKTKVWGKGDVHAWKGGRTVPHKAVRKSVYDALANEMRTRKFWGTLTGGPS